MIQKFLTFIMALSVMGLMACLVACGQNGPLYHPDQPPPIKTVFPGCS